MSLTQSYIKGDLHPNIEETTFPKRMLKIFNQYPDKLAYIFKSFQYGFKVKNTYTEFRTIINNIINGFHSIGLQHQDVICVFLPNTLDYIYTENIKTVYHKCGFPDEASLFRYFKKEYAITPKKYALSLLEN